MTYYLFGNNQGIWRGDTKTRAIEAYCERRGVTPTKAKKLIEPVKEISQVEYRIRQKEERQ